MPYTKEVHDYLLTDRQWTRPLRIAHAKLQLALARKKDKDKIGFWQQVIEANGEHK